MSRKTHRVEWQNERKFLGTAASGHSLLMDGSSASEGPIQAVSPMELIALGLGGCSSVDVVSILQKKRLKLEGCHVVLEAERADTTPAVFTSIHLHFVITGTDIPERAVAQAVSLSADKYCSVSKMLEAGHVNITHDFEIKST